MTNPTNPKWVPCKAAAVLGTAGLCFSLQASAVDESAFQELERKYAALAEKVDRTSDRLQINGFISAGVARSDQDVTYAESELHDDNSFGVRSRVGVQMTFAVSDNLDAIAQFVGRGGEEWDVETEWAYLRYQANDALQLRLGRQRAPFYLLSEYLEVGYAYPWVAPPEEVYSVTGDNTYDGFGLLYDFALGSWDTTFQLFWGENTQNGVVVAQLDDLISLSLTGVYENWTLRAGYTHVNISVEDPIDLGGGFFLPAVEDADTAFMGIGLIYDNGDWLVMSEVTSLKLDFWLGDPDSMYVMAGRRFGDWMPHLTWAQVNDVDDDRGELGLPAPVLAGVNAMFEEQQKSVTAGVRYEFLPGAAIKFEVTHLYDLKDGKGLFDSMPDDDSANLVSFVVDAVF